MKGLVIGLFILLVLAATNLEDPFGSESRARIEQQTQLQIANIQANAALEAIRLEHAAAMERAQFRAQLIAKLVNALPLSVGIICGALLLGMVIHYRGNRQMVVATEPMNPSPAGYLEMSPRGLLSASTPQFEISAWDLQELKQQAHATGHRLDVVRQGNQQTALLIDNVSGQVRAERAFVLEGE